VSKKQSCGDHRHSVQKTTQITLGKVLFPSFNFAFLGFCVVEAYEKQFVQD
jgi:hypothetical protein